MSRVTRTISLAWLVLAIAITSIMAQPNPAVLDSAGQPLLPGVEYYIQQVNGGGALTLVIRNDSCPLYVGQVEDSGSTGLPVVLTPFFAEDTVIAESRDFRIAFSAATTCVQSTAWLNGGTESGGRRLIVTGSSGEGGFGGFFKISKNGGDGYNIEWCPTDACPICRFICGTAGIFSENGNKILALDGPTTLPVVFNKA